MSTVAYQNLAIGIGMVTCLSCYMPAVFCHNQWSGCNNSCFNQVMVVATGTPAKDLISLCKMLQKLARSYKTDLE